MLFADDAPLGAESQALLVETQRQLGRTPNLYFHPDYMARLLAADARALPEGPLKIIVVAVNDSAVSLRWPRIDLALARYDALVALGVELAALVQKISRALV
jgi:hypothetical protein